MQIHIKIYILLTFSLISEYIYAQKNEAKDKKLIQFSGIVVTGDSLYPVSFANIFIENTKRGTISDYNGFFSFVAKENDNIVFSALGYKTVTFHIPDTLTSSKYSWIQVMTADTFYLSETVIVPWPSLEQFKKAFVSIEIPNDDMQRAEKNLALSVMKEKYQNYPMDGSMNFKNYMEQQIYKNYYNGQYMPNNLLNPIAWAQFIKAWKEGKFKRGKNK